VSQQPNAAEVEPEAVPAADDAGSKKKKKKDKGGRKTVSGIQTMFRVTYQNHIQLSQLADNKANMLISINGLMTSVLVAALAPRLTAATWLLTPAIVLLAGCVPSLVFAVLTLRPRLNRTPTTVEQVRANEGNLLFFGQFSGMPLAEFNESMHTLIDDPRLLQDSLIRQLWLMGQSLRQKYRFLQVAYALFLLGVGGAGIVLVVQLVTRYGSAPL
jgi:hypothetical protein